MPKRLNTLKMSAHDAQAPRNGTTQITRCDYLRCRPGQARLRDIGVKRPAVLAKINRAATTRPLATTSIRVRIFITHPCLRRPATRAGIIVEVKAAMTGHRRWFQLSRATPGI